MVTKILKPVSGGRRRKKGKRKTGIFLIVLVIAAVLVGYFYSQKSTIDYNAMLTRNLSGKNLKTNIGLANFAWNALDSRSGYVFGATGQTVTAEFLQHQAGRFAGNERANLVGPEIFSIYRRYRGHPAFDCIGLIKAYTWLDEKTGKISPSYPFAMPDCTANGLLQKAVRYGPAAAMPDIPGLVVQMSGHTGVYVGNGEVIEARGNRLGVTKTKFRGRGWKWYLYVPSIEYVGTGTYFIHGQEVTFQNFGVTHTKAVPGIFNRVYNIGSGK
jgi:hypothetical protein